MRSDIRETYKQKYKKKKVRMAQSGSKFMHCGAMVLKLLVHQKENIQQ
jgi:hypothetical protein